MSQQPQRGGRGRGRGARGSAPSTRGRGSSPAPSAGGTESSFSTRGGATGGGGLRGGPRGGGPSVASQASYTQGGRGGPPGRGGGQAGRGGGGFRGGHGGGGPAQIFATGQPLRQDARIGELDQLVQSFKRLQVQPEMPLRPGWGTLGRAGVVRANFFAVRLPPKATWYEYEIAFSPQGQVKNPMRARVMEILEQTAEFAPYVRHVAHDRAQRMISVQKLPQPLAVPIRYLEEDQKDDPKARIFTVEIKLIGELETSTLVQ